MAPIPAPPAPAPAPAPPSPLDDLLQRPRSPITDLLNRPLNIPPLGEVVVKEKRLPKPATGGRGGLSIGGLFTLLARFSPLLMFPSPIGDQPDDPDDFGEKFRGDEPNPLGTPPITAPDQPTTEILETVRVEQPRIRPGTQPITAPSLSAIPEPFVRAPFPIKPKTSPFPNERRKKGPDFDFSFRPLPTPIAQPLPQPTPRPSPSPRPVPIPAPQPAPFPRPAPRPSPSPLPAPGGIPPGLTGARQVCSCRTIDPNKKKKRKKKPEAPEPAEIEVEYTQGKSKVKVEGKVEKLCVIQRVPIPKLSRRGIRKTRLVRKCF